jgi:hypothetical protein
MWYRAYWDAYAYYTDHKPWYIFTSIAFAFMFIYRYAIGGSMDTITKSIPFTVDFSEKHEEYFIQYQFTNTNKVIKVIWCVFFLLDLFLD